MDRQDVMDLKFRNWLNEFDCFKREGFESDDGLIMRIDHLVDPDQDFEVGNLPLMRKAHLLRRRSWSRDITQEVQMAAICDVKKSDGDCGGGGSSSSSEVSSGKAKKRCGQSSDGLPGLSQVNDRVFEGERHVFENMLRVRVDFGDDNLACLDEYDGEY